MGETNGNHRSIFSTRSTAAPPPSRVPRGRTQMAKSIARFLVAVMAVAAMALASVAGTGLAQAQTNTPTDRDVLVALYDATSGDNWANNDNWLSDAPIGQWHGVTTGPSGRVTVLDLTRNQLSGAIPAELGRLTNLQRLDLFYNRLSGEIPAELGSLTNLEWLDLSYNQLTGTIPVQLGDLTNLQRLSLTSIQLTGPIPPELGSLANLQVLALGGNQLTGPIPTELGSLTNLEKVHLWRNQLTGPIPTELGSLTNLERLNLQGNQLSGEIPSELGSLSNLRFLYLQGNQLSGEIPSELGSLSNLRFLYLSGNQLSGEIPSELGSLSNLRILYLFGNPSLSGPLPGSFTGLTSLNSLDLTATGLCAPTDAAFQAWLRGIAYRHGVVNCAAEEPVPAGPPVVPGAPRGLRAAVKADEAKVDLSWTAPISAGGAPITGYKIESSEDGSDPWVEVYTTTDDSVAYTDEGADSNGPMFAAGTTRYYRVLAVNSVGTGPPSNVAIATAEEPVPAGPCLVSWGALTAPVTRLGAWARDCPSTARSGSYARYYSFSLSEAKRVEINLTSAADPYLALRRGEGSAGEIVTSNDNVGSRNFNSSINRMLAAGTYTVEATTYFAAQSGNFTLSVRPLQETEDLGDLTRSVDRSNSAWTSNHESTQQMGSYARSYTFTLDAATHVVINLTSPEDPYLFLLDANGAVVHENDNVTTRNLNSRIDETLAAGTYTIEATTYFPGRTGTFHLSIGYFGRSQ